MHILYFFETLIQNFGLREGRLIGRRVLNRGGLLLTGSDLTENKLFSCSDAAVVEA